MSTPEDKLRQERSDAVIAAATSRIEPAQRETFDAFARMHLRQADADDLLERSAEDGAGALIAHWQFGAQRTVGTPKVRVFNPTVAEHGWASRHSVLAIVNDDMPFLVDSTLHELARQGLTLQSIVHPLFEVERDAAGRLTALRPRSAEPRPGGVRESWMLIEIDRLVDPAQRTALIAGVERVLADVRAAVTDWPAMLERLQQAIAEMDGTGKVIDATHAAEARAFLEWLAADHFTALGYRLHDLVTDDKGEDVLRLVAGSGLGVLRETAAEQASASFSALPRGARELARAPLPALVVTKANTRATVHRPGYTDYVGVKRYDANGQVTGEHRFVGLFTSSAYTERVSETPLLRGKVDAVARRAGLPPGGHLAKALDHILESYPRDELFQMSEEELYDNALGILALGERQRLRLFLRRDPFDRFVSALVFVPREAYSTELRVKFQRILLDAFAGTAADFEVQIDDTALARIHFMVRTKPGAVPPYELKTVEAQLAEAARRWPDQLRDALIDAEGEARGLALYKRWAAAFPPRYRERVAPRAAVHDLRMVDRLSEAAPLTVNLYRPLGADASTLGFKVYRQGQPIVLSDSLPMLEHMGLRVLAEANDRLDGEAAPVHLYDYELQAAGPEEIDIDAVGERFEQAFQRVFRGEVENDEFNRLVLGAGLDADQVVVLRAYAKYLQQTGFAMSQSTIAATLAAHPRMTRMLVALFEQRFNPANPPNAAAEQTQVEAIERALGQVANLSEDRVLRQILALIEATLRTNFWRTGVGHSGAAGPRREFLSFKFESAKVPGLPEPRPLYEIFVYSPRFEGIHLRGGKVARGGLRWSDRPDDFRTEVLGLVKAQMVKNTVIVPVGSKGGFVVKRAPPASDREAYLKEGIACYQDYLRGLLDLTDNLVAGKPVPPPQVVRHDADDPYLVVAADKGTASFSDFANAVSKEYGHWLGDAFASGGSVGYDHKGMGITARGAWESVKRHFRELGRDIQTADFTTVGVGDMSGDVFGNGMLLSKHTRVVAAFDHRHIFIDPNPDAATSWVERDRLFKLPRSSWEDYDKALISAGGGVFARTEKSIALSPEARAALGIEAERLAPTDLMSAILKAPVDLLYNGGIGTYVKASTQTHADVGDRANDGLRVDGRDLRCKVLGEGGNLGCTQLGRVEAALAGVRLNTDAIDNSAGVDTSDHEVNIKILLGLAIADGEMTEKQRNTLLAEMTGDVAALVLRDNIFQTQVLSLLGSVGLQLAEAEARFMRWLEQKGRLNRAVEYLPTDETLAERRTQGIGFTTPERAVLLAYAKMWLFDEILASDLPEDPWIGSAVARYFPAALRERFAGDIARHPLKREIVATHVLNSMVNRVGVSFTHRLTETTGATAAQVVRAYLAVREIYGDVTLWQEVEALDNVVPDAVQTEMLVEEGWLTARATTWLLRSRRVGEPLADLIARFEPAVAAMRAKLEPAALAASPEAQVWLAAGVPEALARRIAAADGLYYALDVAEIAAATQRPLGDVVDVFVDIGQRLGLARLRAQIEELPADTHWRTLAKAALGDDLAAVQRAIAEDAMSGKEGSAADLLSGWAARSAEPLARAERLLAELAEVKHADMAMLSVALRELRQLA